MSDEMFAELMAVAGMTNETNRLANGYQMEIERALPHLMAGADGARRAQPYAAWHPSSLAICKQTG